MEPQYLVVELRRPEELIYLRKQLSDLRSELAEQKQKYRELETKFGYEVYLNDELCDLCREAGVSFRPALDRANRFKSGLDF